MFTFMDKAIVSFVMPGLMAALAPWLSGFGTSAAMDWETVLTMVLTGVITFAVPGFGKTISGFVVPPVVAAIASAVMGLGITGHMSATTVLTMLATGLLTHIVPNKA